MPSVVFDMDSKYFTDGLKTVAAKWADEDRAGEHSPNEQRAWAIGYYAGSVHNARLERERIIKLLDEMLADNWDWTADCTCDGCIRINKMFALIKGEQK